MATSNKTKWLATIILALVMAVSVGFGATFIYEANAEEEVEPTKTTATIIGAETRPQIVTGLIYFAFSTDAEFKDQILSLQTNPDYANYFYLNDKRLIDTDAFKHTENYNSIHMNWAGGNAHVPLLYNGAQQWFIAMSANGLTTGDKLIIKQGLNVPNGTNEAGEPIFINLDRDYEFVYDGTDQNYPNFGEVTENLVFGTVFHSTVEPDDLRVGFNIPFSMPEASINTYAYYRNYVLFDDQVPHVSTGAEDTVPEDYIHKNLDTTFGWPADMQLKPDTTYMYFAANNRKITLKAGMYVAAGKRLDRDYVFEKNTETNTWMCTNIPLSLYSENAEDFITNVDEVNATLYIPFSGWSTNTCLDMEVYFPKIASSVKFNGKTIAEVNAEETENGTYPEKQVLWLHLNHPNYASYGKTTWMMTIKLDYLAKIENPTITLEKGITTDSGILDKTYNFVYDKTAQKWNLAKEIIEDVTLCDENGDAVELSAAYSVGIGETINLPKYAKIDLNSGIYKIVPMNWDNERFAAAGEYTVNGTVAFDANKYDVATGVTVNYSATVTVKKETITNVTVCDEEGTAVTAPAASITVGIGATLDLPEYVALSLDSERTVVVALNWSKTDCAAPGTYTTVATIDYNQDELEMGNGVNFALSVEVTVEDSVVSIGTFEDINTYYGTEVTLPATVTAKTYNDVSVTLNVNWTDCESGKFTASEAKEYTFNGTVVEGDTSFAAGVSLEVTVKLVAAKVKITVTANDATIKVGENVPYFTYEVTSGALVAGDTLDRKANIHANCEADGTVAGTFDIVVSGTSDYYDITFVSGTLTVKEAKASGGACGGFAGVSGGLTVILLIASLGALALVKAKRNSLTF